MAGCPVVVVAGRLVIVGGLLMLVVGVVVLFQSYCRLVRFVRFVAGVA